MTRPKVSIVTITYNQEKYIQDAIESFLMQKREFAIEIIISDDASTDKTPKIIENYARKYPELIKPILREENIGPVPNSINALKAAKGKYIALCEGDDFWTDPTKIARQARFLDNHKNFFVCFHPVKVFFEDKKNRATQFPGPNLDISVENLLRNNFIPTNSVMYRRKSLNDIPENILPFDWYLHLYHARSGQIGFINRRMAAYRRHDQGLWWDSHSNMDNLWKKHGLKYINLYIAIKKLFPESRYQKIINSSLIETAKQLAKSETRTRSGNLGAIAKDYPDIAEMIMLELAKDLDRAEREVNQTQETTEEYKQMLSESEQKLRDQKTISDMWENEVMAIKSTKIWKVKERYGKLRSLPRRSKQE